MSLPLQSKIALVTGSTDGLGKAIAKGLLKENVHVILHGRSKETVSQTLHELQEEFPKARISHVVCDLTHPEKIKDSFSSLKKLDILINNAGVWLEGNTIDATPEKITKLVNVNMLSPLLITQQLLPVLLTSEYSQIIQIASIAGVEIPAGYYHTIYTATKFALQGFTEGLAKEFYGKNLRIMGYYPGGMDTNIFKKAGNDYKMDSSWMFDKEESVEAILFMLTRSKKTNLKRMDLVNQLEK